MAKIENMSHREAIEQSVHSLEKEKFLKEFEHVCDALHNMNCILNFFCALSSDDVFL